MKITVKQVVPLQPMQRTRGEIIVPAAHRKDLCRAVIEGLQPVRGMLEQEASEEEEGLLRKELLWTNHYPVFPLHCTTWRVKESRLRNNGMKLTLGKRTLCACLCEGVLAVFGSRLPTLFLINNKLIYPYLSLFHL